MIRFPDTVPFTYVLYGPIQIRVHDNASVWILLQHGFNGFIVFALLKHPNDNQKIERAKSLGSPYILNSVHHMNRDIGAVA